MLNVPQILQLDCLVKFVLKIEDRGAFRLYVTQITGYGMVRISCFHRVFRRTFRICLPKIEVEDEDNDVEEEKEDENEDLCEVEVEVEGQYEDEEQTKDENEDKDDDDLH